MTFPTSARMVIVGGGIAGASIAYHLTKLGIRDVVLLECGKLTDHGRLGASWNISSRNIGRHVQRRRFSASIL